jgi:hypothetical protein
MLERPRRLTCAEERRAEKETGVDEDVALAALIPL